MLSARLQVICRCDKRCLLMILLFPSLLLTNYIFELWLFFVFVSLLPSSSRNNQESKINWRNDWYFLVNCDVHLFVFLTYQLINTAITINTETYVVRIENSAFILICKRHFFSWSILLLHGHVCVTEGHFA